MDKEFIVGVDFGHGETAAYIVPLCEIKDKEGHVISGDYLSINIGNKAQERVRHSVVYCSKSNKYSLFGGEGMLLISGFKGRISEIKNEGKDEAYKAYIQLIFDTLCNNNKQYLKKDKNGEWNFYFCIACPTRWTESEREEYITFFNDALSERNISVFFVMNESDAAYFTKSNALSKNETTLVIDYGSSTIDYTLIKDRKKISDDSWSNQKLGAHLIEEKLYLNYIDSNFEEFNSVMEKTISLLIESKNEHFVDNINEILKYRLRRAKEAAYNDNDNTLLVKHSLFKESGYEKLKNKDCVFDIDIYNIEEEIENYCNDVKKDFEDLALNIKNTILEPVNHVILSGGACIMPWVKKYVEEIFPNAIIDKDEYPQYVVAKGIALYAKAQLECLEKLRSAVRAIDYKIYYRDADISATKQYFENSKPSLLKQMEYSNIKTGSDLRTYICNFMSKTDDSDENFRETNFKLRDIIIGKRVCSEIAKIVKDQFGSSIDVTCPDFHVDAKINVTWRKGNFNAGGNGYRDIGNYIRIGSGHVWNYEWNKVRPIEELKKTAEGALIRYCNDYNAPIDDDCLKTVGENIKVSAVQVAEKIFYRFQLFATTFS